MTDRQGISRRGLLGAAGAAVATGVAGYAAHAVLTGEESHAADTTGPVEFHGAHQAGIVTPAQDRLHFATFDVTTTKREDVIALLKEWTAAAALMTAGRDIGQYGAVNGPGEAPPEDTGEAVGLPPARLTLTIGFGPSFFVDAKGNDRFGLKGKRPAALVDLPHFIGDNLDPNRSGGDIAVQACSDDPQVAVHAIRNLARIGFGTTVVSLLAARLRPDSSTSRAQTTPRNLFGFKDGTNNLKLEDTAKLEQQLWVQHEDGTGLDGRRFVPGLPPDPDDDRDLGPDLARRAGGDRWPGQGHRRSAGQGGRVRPDRLRGEECRR